MVWGGKGFSGFSFQPSYPGHGHLPLDHVAASPIQPGLELPWRHFSWGNKLKKKTNKKIKAVYLCRFPDLYTKLPGMTFSFITPCFLQIQPAVQSQAHVRSESHLWGVLLLTPGKSDGGSLIMQRVLQLPAGTHFALALMICNL